MKRLLSPLLIFALLIIGSGAHGGQQDLKQGEYKLFAYTLSSDNSDAYSEIRSVKSISFNTLYISPAAMDKALNRDRSQLGVPEINQENYQSFAFKAAYAATPDITFHSAIALTDTAKPTDIKYTDRVGWEVDLGLAYSFFNNFAYEVHFGYMDTGELFTRSNSLTDVDNITIVTNKLTMSF